MTRERFTELLAAYGADTSRWPPQEQAAARALLARDPAALQASLQQAQQLDQWLQASEVAPPDTALLQRIAATAPVAAKPAAAATGGWRPRWRPYWLWPGAGLAAGISLAGSLAGAFTVSLLLRAAAPGTSADWPERGTAFSAAPADWSEE